MPGPGAYNDASNTISGNKSQRGISSMKSKEERLRSLSKDQMQIPGPGAYNSSKNAVKDKQPNVKFGKDQRKGVVSREEQVKPGPGTYEIKNLKSARGVKIG